MRPIWSTDGSEILYGYYSTTGYDVARILTLASRRSSRLRHPVRLQRLAALPRRSLPNLGPRTSSRAQGHPQSLGEAGKVRGSARVDPTRPGAAMKFLLERKDHNELGGYWKRLAPLKRVAAPTHGRYRVVFTQKRPDKGTCRVAAIVAISGQWDTTKFRC